MSVIAESWVWRITGRAGRLLLLGALAFWWGAYVLPHLVSLAFPTLLPPWNTTLGRLNASNEGTIANSVSAATLAGVTLLVVATAVINHRRSAGWMAVGGWAAIALTTAAVTFEELAEFKKYGPVAVVGHAERLGLPWPVLVSPLVVAFVLVMWVFIRQGPGAREARAPLTLGITCWVFALLHEAIDPWVFYGRARAVGLVLEETLEFSGTLLIGLSAALVVQGGRPPPYRLFGDQSRTSIVGSVAAVVLLGGLAVAFLFRPPLVEALAPYTRAEAFGVSLQRHEALVQELRMPATPLHSVRLRLANCDPGGPSGTVAVRFTTLDAPDRLLSRGSIQVPAGDCPRWRDIELLPPLTVAEGTKLALQVAADIESGSELRIGATKGDRYPDGRLWINGTLAWPDQNLEFVAYGAPEPTRAKLAAMVDLAATDWRWLLLAADVFIALTLITVIPVRLADAALSPGRRMNVT
ncbi:MAG: hypothetical protein OXR64_07220 [Chloroflexota bacterium]|nr:hypothetical protein [Chloroflexota bacterium]